MCLLVVVSRVDPAVPLILGANRDERVDRPTTAATVLRPEGPRILGGRDHVAGGTWLAVNEHGVVAGLTNRPSPDGRDPSKRSRGELPMALAGHVDARSAVDAFTGQFRPDDFNPAWILVGDRESLFYLDMTQGARPEAAELPPGIHILENNPLGAPSPKTSNIRDLIDRIDPATGLRGLLADHRVPADSEGLPEGVDPAVLAACVHTAEYGTRSSSLIRVPADRRALPEVSVADGHPCTSSFADVSTMWSA